MASILLIDDSAMVRELIKEAIEPTHMFSRVFEAESGREGFEVLNRHDIDIVVCDLVMPGSSGYEFLELRRSVPSCAEVPTIILTSAESTQPLVDSLRGGASDFLHKPFIAEELITRLRAHVALRAQQIELNQANADVARYQLHLENIISSMVDAVVVLDTREHITLTNHAFLELLGYADQEARGMAMQRFFAADDLLQMTGVATALGAGRVHNLNVSFVAKDGTRIPSNVSGSTMYDPEGSVQGYVLVAHDIRETQRILAQESRALAAEAERAEELRRARDELDIRTQAELKHAKNLMVQSEKLSQLGQLVASVGHEISSPVWLVDQCAKNIKAQLGTIRENLFKLFDESPEATAMAEKFANLFDRVEGQLDAQETASTRLQDVSAALRTQSRIDDKTSEDVDINRVVRESLMLVAGKTKLHTLAESLSDLPPVSCFRTRIGQVVTNILSNAADALSEKVDQERQASRTFLGKIRVETYPKNLGGRDGIAITVSDNGDGVPDSIRDKIFEDFFTTKPAGLGTGLGLSMCKTIIEDHHGKLEVDRDPDLKGARFSVWIPVAFNQHRAAPSDEAMINR